MHSVEVEIERNYAAFKGLLPRLISQAAGQYALMKDQALIALCGSAGEAVREGHAKFGDEPFSIQLISDEPVDLGFFGYAPN